MTENEGLKGINEQCLKKCSVIVSNIFNTQIDASKYVVNILKKKCAKNYYDWWNFIKICSSYATLDPRVI